LALPVKQTAGVTTSCVIASSSRSHLFKSSNGKKKLLAIITLTSSSKHAIATHSRICEVSIVAFCA
jgi:hypothetical protein